MEELKIETWEEGWRRCKADKSLSVTVVSQ